MDKLPSTSYIRLVDVWLLRDVKNIFISHIYLVFIYSTSLIPFIFATFIIFSQMSKIFKVIQDTKQIDR